MFKGRATSSFAHVCQESAPTYRLLRFEPETQSIPRCSRRQTLLKSCLQSWHATCEMMIARTNKTNCTSTHSEKSITELFMPTSDNTKGKIDSRWSFLQTSYSCCLISPLHGFGALAVFEPEAHSAFCRVVPDQAFMFPEVLSNPSSAK